MTAALARESATFPPVDESVAQARRFVRKVLASWGADGTVDDVVLLTSELVTNAIIHSGTDTEVVCSLLPGAVQVEIVDHYPTRWLPAPPSQVEDDSEGGRGLALTTAIALAWGIEYTAATKRVWFKVPLPELGPVSADETGAPVSVADRSLGVAVLRLDAQGVISEWSRGAAELFGWAADQAAGRPLSELLGPGEEDRVKTSLASARWQGSYTVRNRDGGETAVHARHVRVADPDGDSSVVCLLVDQRLRALLGDPAPTTPHQVSQEGDDDALVPSAAALVRLGLDELLQRTAEWARDAVAGDAGFVLLATDAENELELRATTGLPGRPPRYPRVMLEEGISGRLARSLMPAVYDDLTAGPGSHQWLQDAGARSLVTVPLLAEGRMIGTIGVTSAQPRRFSNDDGARLQRAADAVALPVQAARLTEIERHRRGWLSYLAEASDLLAGTLELEMTLALVAQLVVPRLAAWCGVYLLDESGTSHAAYVWHADEDRLEDLRLLLSKVPPPELRSEHGARDWAPAEGTPLDGLERCADLAAAGAAVVPLVARGRPIGCLALGRTGSQPLRREILELAGDLARRAALALDNARLYEERSSTSNALQRSLLPPELPELTGVEIGVAYEATGSGNDVGGDFYDVFPLDGSRFAFAIGDVCGKGPEAAAVTGLARHALRLLGRRGDDLRDVLEHLNAAILDEGSRSRFVTVVYGEGEALADGGLRLRFASAGHPLPLLLDTDGDVRTVGRAGDLLGVFPRPAVTVYEVELAPNEMIVCFTDGVSERRDGRRMLGEDGVAAAVAAAAGLPAPSLARRLSTLVRDFAGDPPRDDMAVLVLRAL